MGGVVLERTRKDGELEVQHGAQVPLDTQSLPGWSDAPMSQGNTSGMARFLDVCQQTRAS